MCVECGQVKVGRVRNHLRRAADADRDRDWSEYGVPSHQERERRRQRRTSTRRQRRLSVGVGRRRRRRLHCRRLQALRPRLTPPRRPLTAAAVQ